MQPNTKRRRRIDFHWRTPDGTLLLIEPDFYVSKPPGFLARVKAALRALFN